MGIIALLYIFVAGVYLTLLYIFVAGVYLALLYVHVFVAWVYLLLYTCTYSCMGVFYMYIQLHGLVCVFYMFALPS